MRPYLSYAIGFALLLFIVKQVEFRFVGQYLSAEQLIFIIGTVFMGLGIWLSWHLFKTPTAPTTITSHQLGISSTLNLSNRELEVLELIAKGHTNNEIAKLLFISLNTVKTHVSNIYQKLGVKRRTQAIQCAREQGILH